MSARDPRTSLVGAGYDAMAETWATWSTQVTDDPRLAWLDKLTGRLTEPADVLELGCGNGPRETQELARRHRLTCVDLSQEQLRRARERVPEATFVHADLTTVEFPPQSFDAVCAFYVLNHVPRELLAPLFARVHEWLRPGGFFLASLGVTDEADWQGEWLGVPMYFSGFPPEGNRRLLTGFTMLEDEVVSITEPEGSVEFQWVLAQR